MAQQHLFYSLLEAAAEQSGSTEHFFSLVEQLEMAPLVGSDLGWACSELQSLISILCPSDKSILLSLSPSCCSLSSSSTLAPMCRTSLACSLQVFYESFPNISGNGLLLLLVSRLPCTCCCRCSAAMLHGCCNTLLPWQC